MYLVNEPIRFLNPAQLLPKVMTLGEEPDGPLENNLTHTNIPVEL